MPTISNADIFDRCLTPWFSSLTTAEAKKLAEFQLDPALDDRIAELFEKSNEGELTPAEQAEYTEYVRATNLIGILKAKARQILREQANS